MATTAKVAKTLKTPKYAVRHRNRCKSCGCCAATCASSGLCRICFRTRPGTTTFTVMPSRATSRATVFDQPTREDRRALEMPRFGMGAITPDDVLVMTRPHFFARMAGMIRSVTAITDSTID